MSVRTVFTIVIRLYGLFVIVKSALAFLQVLHQHLRLNSGSDVYGEDIFFVLITLIVPTVTGIIGLMLISMANRIIETFQLTEDIDSEQFFINFNLQQIVEVSLCIVGIIYIVDIINLASQDFISYFQSRDEGDIKAMKNVAWLMGQNLFQIGVIVLLLYNASTISRWVTRRYSETTPNHSTIENTPNSSADVVEAMEKQQSTQDNPDSAIDTIDDISKS